MLTYLVVDVFDRMSQSLSNNTFGIDYHCQDDGGAIAYSVIAMDYDKHKRFQVPVINMNPRAWTRPASLNRTLRDPGRNVTLVGLDSDIPLGAVLVHEQAHILVVGGEKQSKFPLGLPFFLRRRITDSNLRQQSSISASRVTAAASSKATTASTLKLSHGLTAASPSITRITMLPSRWISRRRCIRGRCHLDGSMLFLRVGRSRGSRGRLTACCSIWRAPMR